MSSSQFAIFCIILIYLFTLHECMCRQGTSLACVPTNCDNKDKNRNCVCCFNPTKRKTTCFKSKAKCTAASKA
ncbi:hypothetical protein Bca4012_061279 [Brassica carinata]